MPHDFSIGQFRTKVEQAGPALEGKVKLQGQDDLKTYGTTWKGKLACWFQPKASRIEQSQQVRQAFIDAITREYGNDAFVGNIVQGLRNDIGKRLSLRTVHQAIEQLDAHKREIEANDHANHLTAETFAKNAYPQINPSFGHIFSEMANSLGYPIPTDGGQVDIGRLGGLTARIQAKILEQGRTGQARVTPQQAEAIAKTEIEQYIIEQYATGQARINNADDAVKFLSGLSQPNAERGVQIAFDALKGTPEGLAHLQNACLRLLETDLEESTPETYLRGNTPAIKLTTAVLNLMTAHQTENLLEQFRAEIPHPFPTKEDGERNLTTAFKDNVLRLSGSFAQKATTTWANSLTPETKTFLKQIRDLASRFEATVGPNPGQRTVNHFLGLRVLSPALFKEMNILLARQTELNRLRDRGELTGPQQTELQEIGKQRAGVTEVAKTIQLLSNIACGDGTIEGLMSKNPNSQFARTFLEDGPTQTSWRAMVDTLST